VGTCGPNEFIEIPLDEVNSTAFVNTVLQGLLRKIDQRWLKNLPQQLSIKILFFTLRINKGIQRISQKDFFKNRKTKLISYLKLFGVQQI
jgi:hypothetical protein